MGSVSKRDQLQIINDAVEKFERVGADLVFTRPGMVIRLRKGAVDLALNNGSRCSVVRIDLSHPDNTKMLAELSKGLEKAETLKAVESPLIRMGLTLDAFTKPFFEKMHKVQGDTITIKTTCDGSNKLVRLKAEMPGEAGSTEIEAEATLQAIQSKLEDLGVQGNYKIGMSASRFNLVGMHQDEHKRFFLWVTQPLPSPSTRKPAAWTKDMPPAMQTELTELLDKDPKTWKSQLWEILKDLTAFKAGGGSIDIEPTCYPGKEDKIQLLQALVDDYLDQGFHA